MTINFQSDEIELLRKRLRAMTDDALLEFGKAAAFMCKDKEPREVFLTQLKEAREEWNRRRPRVAVE